MKVTVTARRLDKAQAVAAAYPGVKAFAVADSVTGADVVVVATGFGDAAAAAEEIAKSVPTADVVKAFNTVFAQVLAEGAGLGTAIAPTWMHKS